MMAAVLVFLTGPLGFLPKAALGAVLIVAAIGLFDVAELLWLSLGVCVVDHNDARSWSFR
jgi:MFS superfamily sulfate permease-like transporter